MSNNIDDFLFGNAVENKNDFSVFDKKQPVSDGLYRPNLKDAKDQKIGYFATFRFLPNIFKAEDGSIKKGAISIPKHTHYVKIPSNVNLNGYYDCMKHNFGEPCALCAEHSKLKYSKNVADNEKAEVIGWTDKFYSYVQIIEDVQHPELVGKIMIYELTIKHIIDKIKEEKDGLAIDPTTGQHTNISCDVFNLISGKDFRLIIKPKGDGKDNKKIDYTTSMFLASSPIRLFDEKDKKFKQLPADENGVYSAKVMYKVKDYLLNREFEIDKFQPTKWNEQTRDKVNQIISFLEGDGAYVATQSIHKAKTDNSTKISAVNTDVQTADDFFSIDDE